MKPKPRVLTADEVVARNRLYATGPLRVSRCREPHYRPTSYAAVRAYYVVMLRCLNYSWHPTIAKARAPFRSPNLMIYAGTLRTPCGVERGTRAYYCGGNRTIYMPWQVDQRNYKQNQVWARTWMANTFAHEYGHHVQMMTGILGASWQRQRRLRGAATLQESRRRELQASCLGSVYLGADSGSFPLRGPLLTMWRFTVYHAGDEYSKPKVRDHGGRVNHGWWSMRGFNTRNPRDCNTFTATARATN